MPRKPKPKDDAKWGKPMHERAADAVKKGLKQVDRKPRPIAKAAAKPTNSGIKLESDVPIPQPQLYPWGEMKPGDSFFANGKKPMDLHNSVKNFRKKRPDWTFMFRTKTENGKRGARAWRVT